MMLFFCEIILTLQIVTFKHNPNHDRNVYSMKQSEIFQSLGVGDKIKSYLLNGFIGDLTSESIKKLKKNKDVAYVEEDKKISVKFNIENIQPKIPKPGKEKWLKAMDDEKLSLTYQKDAPWGISRISSGTNVNANHVYRYPVSSADDVTVYILDTGIFLDHKEFKGRARFGANFTTSENDSDENGHGTHCAGVIGGKNVGIAKKVEMVAVKVLEGDGNGMLSSLVMGIDYVIREHSDKQEEIDRKGKWFDETFDEFFHQKKSIISEMMNISLPFGYSNFISQFSPNVLKPITIPRKKRSKKIKSKQNNGPKTIVNMSVGGLRSDSLEYAIKYATEIGIHFSVAAGNDHRNACNYSPSSSNMVLTAGASTKNDTIAFFSNFGHCVDLYAPGVEILSSWVKNEYRVVSGTSMAAPHVTGSMALYLSELDYSPKELIDTMKKDSYLVIKKPGKSMREYPLASIRKLLREIHTHEKENAW